MKRSLNTTTIKAAKPRTKPYKLSDGGGLYLLVTSSGSKLWRYKFRLAGKERTYGIGQFPEVGLALAREEHERARQLVASDLSPVEVRRSKAIEQLKAASNSFEAISGRWFAEKSKNWSSGYQRQVLTTLERDVFPAIGKHDIRKVMAAQLRTVIKTVAERHKPTDGKRERDKGATTVAILIRQWCSGVFRYAVANGLTDLDPTYALRDLVTRPKVVHHKHLLAGDVQPFLQKVRSFTGTDQVRIAIELLLVTFVRTGELRGAEWGEIDLEKRLWRIPAHRMKMNRVHLVPLSTRAMSLLKELSEITGGERFLFPNQRSPGQVMSMTTINRAIERLGYAGRVSGHGFRGTASTILNEAGFSSKLIEKQLAHDSKNSVEASYNHAEYLAERTKMMDFWGDFVESANEKIVLFKKTG